MDEGSDLNPPHDRYIRGMAVSEHDVARATSVEDRAWLDPRMTTERASAWAATMDGHRDAAVRVAHGDSHVSMRIDRPLLREAREEREAATLATGATRSNGAGHRRIGEAPDPVRTCFERDRDRILHSSAYRRLAGKTQVFVFPSDHQRTRLTHAIEVAQVARSIAQACHANVALVEAIALGHDCGHGPGGHASEDALTPYIEGGYDHAVWGADITLRSLNLCAETLDGIRNHSWSRPAPSTVEGEIVSWADRIAYVCHDFEDAVHARIVDASMLPAQVVAVCGVSRSSQLNAFIHGVVDAIAATGRIGMTEATADALGAFRRANYEHIYLRPAAQAQATAVVSLLQALVEHFAGSADQVPQAPGEPVVDARSREAYRRAVTYVSGMTDRFACQSAVTLLGCDPARLPQGIGVATSVAVDQHCR